MSTLQVQTLQGPTSGADSNTVRVADGHNLHAKGHVVQCVETSDSDVARYISTSSTSFVATGITVSITPQFIGSKVFVDFKCSMAFSPANSGMAVTLFEDGVQATGDYSLGYVLSQSTDTEYSPIGGEYVFTTTSLAEIEFAVYARADAGTDAVTPVFIKSSYILSATEIAQ